MADSHPYGRVGLVATIVVGGVMFAILVPAHFLEQAQYLEYLHTHFPAIYAFLLANETVVALEFVGLSLLATAVYLLLNQHKRTSASQTEQEREPKPHTGIVASLLEAMPEKTNKASASIGDININLHQANQQAQTNKQAVTPAIPIPKEPKPEPHIVRLPPRIAWIQLEDYCYRERESTYTRAAIAIYENEVQEGKKTGDVHNVVAKITFSDERGQEFSDLRVNEGCWLDARTEVNFTRNARHELIIAINYNQRFQILREIAKYGSVRNAKFNNQQLFVKVQLIAHDGILRTDRYALSATEEEFSIEPL